MSVCKYCQKEIGWNKDGERSIPINPDGTRHDCRKREDVKPFVAPKITSFQQAEEAMEKKEAQVKPVETCTSPTVPDAINEPLPEEMPGEVISVSIGATISLKNMGPIGEYSNVKLEIVATDAETARYNFRKEIEETVRMVQRTLKEMGGA